MALSDFLSLLPSDLIVLQLNCKKIDLPFLLLDDLISLRFEVLYFFSDGVFVVECLVGELLSFVCDS